MTQFSRTGVEGPDDVERISADLRRQREELQRQKHAARHASTETRNILEKLAELRRRAEALEDGDPNDRT